MKKARILVVEDEAIIAMDLEDNLRNLGYEVIAVVDKGEKAIQKAGEEKPDLIIMDIRIKGDKDGIKTAEIIRKTLEIPVIFATAYLDEDRIERAKITMPFGYVLKPIQEKDLKITLEMALYVARVDAERREAEKERKRSEELLENTGKMARVGGWEVNLDKRTVYWSAVTKMIHEVPPDYEPTIDEAISFFPDESGRLISNAVRNAIEKGESYALELDFVTARKNRLSVRTIGHSEFNKGKCERLYGTFQDITSQKQAENALLESEEKFRLIFNTLPLMLALWKKEKDAIVLHAINATTSMVSEEKIEKYLGTSLDMFYKDTPWIIEAIENCFSTGETVVDEKPYRYRTTGQTSILSFRFVRIQSDLVMAVSEDVTDRVDAENALRESELRFKAQYQATPIPTWIWKYVENDIVSVDANKAAVAVSKGKATDFIGLTATEIYPDRPDIVKDLKNCFENKTTIRRETEYRARGTGSEGTVIFTYVHAPPDFVLMQVEDITERKETEEQIRFQSQILDCIDQAIIATDLEGQVQYFNRAAENLYQWPAEEALKMNIMDVTVAQMSRKQAAEIMETVGAGGKWSGEFMVQKKGGSTFKAHVTNSPIYDEKGKLIGIVGISREV